MHKYIKLSIRTNIGKTYYKYICNLFNYCDNYRHAKHNVSFNYDYTESYFLNSTGLVAR